MKKIIRVSIVCILGLIFAAQADTVSANEMEQMNIDVFLHENGSATITENRQMTMDDGTELFIELGNLPEDSEVIDFQVEGYSNLQEWDPDASLEEKAGYYTVYDNDGVTELVWGIGEYGQNNYTLSYTLSNVVRNLEDGQSMLWNFHTSPGIPPENLDITVRSGFDFSQDSVDFWGFGMEGDIELLDGDINWQATQADSERAVILMQFDEERFTPTAFDDLTLEEQEEQAKDGSIFDDSSNHLGLLIGIPVLVATILGGVVYSFISFDKKRQKLGHIKEATKLKKRNKNLKRSTPPQPLDPALMFFVLHHLYRTGFDDIFQSYLVKWMKEDKLEVKFTKENKVLNKEVKTTVQLKESVDVAEVESFETYHTQIKEDTYSGSYEDVIWSILESAADKNGLITDDGIKKWGKAQAGEMKQIADYLKEYSKDELINQGYFEQDEMKYIGQAVEINKPLEKGEKLIDDLVQYENYLKAIEAKQMISPSVSDEDAYDYIYWNILFANATLTEIDLSKVTPKDENTMMDDIFVYYYMYPSYGFRQSYFSGLHSGGFHSTTTAGGSGGMTGMGGGAGAGGASGGGAR